MLKNDFWKLPENAQNRTPTPLPGHPRTHPLGKTCTVMGPDWGFAYAPISGLWGVRIFFFQHRNAFFVEELDLGSNDFLSDLVILSSRPR